MFWKSGFREISNIREYQINRDEMQSLKNCITTYLGFVLGGFSISFFGIYAINKCQNNEEAIALILLVLAITASIVLYIIFYKFISHNRYAGYCKLLNQENLLFEGEASNWDIESWEICIDRLRVADLRKYPFYHTIIELVDKNIIDEEEDIDIKKEIISVLGKNSPSDKLKNFNGLWIMFKNLFGLETASSWQFPMSVVNVFLLLTVIYVFLSAYSLYLAFFTIFEWTSFIHLSVIIYIILLFVLIATWWHHAGRLWRLMRGSLTVDAYCWKFLPIRYAFIKEKNRIWKAKIDYKLITLRNAIGSDKAVLEYLRKNNQTP